MNYMEQVAQMLGVELDEEFYIENHWFKYRLTEKSIEYYDESIQRWCVCSSRILELLNGNNEIFKKPILDKAEKRYLSYVIKPFKDKVSYICKKKSDCTKMEWIQIGIEADTNLDFPSFEIGTMYKGMELNREYTLEDLGL